jgi:hypothetical protein
MVMKKTSTNHSPRQQEISMNGMTTNKSLLAGALLLAGSSAFALTGSADSASVFLDTVAPTPGTATPPPTGLLTGFSVPYSSATDGTGTGLARVELWAREDAASWAFSSLFQATASGSYSYTPAGAGSFHFDLVAEDVVGNRSTVPSGSTGTGDGTTLVSGDTTNPVARCQSIAVTLDGGTGTATITAAQIDNGSTDDIAIQSIVVTPDTFDCDDLGDNTVTLTVTDTSNNQDSCQATVTVNRGTACDDGDGISIATEDAGPNGGDGNNDGILDSFQANVATFLNGADAGANVGQYLTLVSPAGTQLSGVGVFPAIPPLPGGVTSFPLGMVSFQVSGAGVQPFPAATVVTLIAEQTPSPITGSYYKVDGPVYTPFDFPVFPLGVTSTGTVFDGDEDLDDHAVGRRRDVRACADGRPGRELRADRGSGRSGGERAAGGIAGELHGDVDGGRRAAGLGDGGGAEQCGLQRLSRGGRGARATERGDHPGGGSRRCGGVV